MRYFEGSTGEVIKRVWVDENDANLAHIKVFLPKENFDSMKDKSFINLEFHYYKPFFSLSKVYHLTDKLTTHSIGGLEALLRYAKEEYKVLRGRRPDGVLWQSEGLYQSILKIKSRL